VAYGVQPQVDVGRIPDVLVDECGVGMSGMLPGLMAGGSCGDGATG
jgi:hypothetical protein